MSRRFLKFLRGVLATSSLRQVRWNWRCDFRQAINLFDPLGCL